MIPAFRNSFMREFTNRSFLARMMFVRRLLPLLLPILSTISAADNLSFILSNVFFRYMRISVNIWLNKYVKVGMLLGSWYQPQWTELQADFIYRLDLPGYIVASIAGQIIFNYHPLLWDMLQITFPLGFFYSVMSCTILKKNLVLFFPRVCTTRAGYMGGFKEEESYESATGHLLELCTLILVTGLL